MNKCILTGNLVKDVELITTESGKSLVKNSIAVKRNYKNADGEYESDFINIIAFGKTAEFMEKYFQKGSKVGIDGKIQTGSYTNKEGQKVYTTDVVVENIEFMESKKKEGQAIEEVKPSDFENKEETNPFDAFQDFGDKLVIDDNFLE